MSLNDLIQPNCSNITLEEVKHAVLIRGSAGTVCFVVCCLTLAFEIVFLCRIKSNFLLRLFFHLTLSSTLFIGTFGLDLVHYVNYDKPSDVPFCKALAFLAVYTASVTLLFVCAIVLVLLRIVFNCAKVRRAGRAVQKKSGKLYVAEGVFVVLAYTLPLLVCWIPLLYGHYGNNAWSYCWFTPGNSSSADDPCEISVKLDEILIFYLPNSIAGLCSMFCVIVLIVWVIRLHCYTRLLREKMKIIIKEMFLFVGFLTAYSITWLVFVISSVAQVEGNTHYSFWLIKSFTNPVIVATIPSSFFFYVFAKYYSHRKSKKVKTKAPRRYLYSSINNATTPPSTRESAQSVTTPVPFSDSRDLSDSSDDYVVIEK